MKNLLKAALAAASLATATSAVEAQTVTSVNGTSYTTSSIDESTTGSDMTGMKVHVCLSNSCYDKTWANLGGSYYGVEETGMFRIRVGHNEDTYNGDWRFDLFSSNDLVTVTMNGFAGNTIFDRTYPNTGTPGSSHGRDADLLNQCVADGYSQNCVNFNNSTVQYSNRVGLNNTFYGDEFEQVKFSFANVSLSGPDASGGFDQDFTQACTGRNGSNCSPVGFYLHMDTDNASLRTTVPEPSTYVLMFAGLGLVGVASRRKRRTA
jgi:hypothetical protein